MTSYKLSKRGEDWHNFQKKVTDHIENYTVPQYGDKDNDNAKDMSPQWCIDNIRRYITRFGKNQRDGQELIDLMKIAHYAQLAYTMTIEASDEG